MNLTLAIPYFNQLEQTKGIMGLLKRNTSPNVEWLIIDNGSHEPIETFFRRTLRPKRLQFIRNDENLGMVKTYQQIFDTVETDLVAILHNDVFIYEKKWDNRVTKAFKDIPNLGALSFFGAQGVGTIGERIQDRPNTVKFAGLSNMLEADEHGMRLHDKYRSVAILDGFAMIFNMQMIKKAGGLDQRYLYHHLYDRDLPLTSLALGYKNVVLDIPCHHVSSLTANQPFYQDWISQKVSKKKGDVWTHDENSRLFAKKWQSVLPIYLESDFSFRKGQFGKRHYQGNLIQKLGPKIVEYSKENHKRST